MRRFPRLDSRTRLWLGLLGGGTSWLAHLAVCGVGVELACVAGHDAAEPLFLGVGGVAWFVLGFTMLTLAGAGGSSWMARQAMHEDGAGEGHVWIARLGYLSGMAFMATILFETVPVLFFLRSCA